MYDREKISRSRKNDNPYQNVCKCEKIVHTLDVQNLQATFLIGFNERPRLFFMIMYTPRSNLSKSNYCWLFVIINFC